MKFLLDENIPLEVRKSLEALGHDVADAHSSKLKGKSDARVLDLAKKEKRLLITLDLDFSNIISYSPKTHPGIIVVRLHSPNRKKIIAAIEQFVKTINAAEIAKALIILEDTEYRIKK